ncbi:hypothetical protein GGE50_002150 [Rhizobium leguminosarum]|jgi:hypothetical protein|nr:hypothetical protein [Rhizobium leguminosarum]MBB4332286.1 hypothetical protein [Rhizobium leguminosarum]MBB4342745.1 hypothetical protein [Rhizobium leguminosarum]MBB4357913.1 hypothetical protein [Rhizobium leguminosarum]MBB4387512.1 hypothetical protein [Rhizobium leguminosarum]
MTGERLEVHPTHWRIWQIHRGEVSRLH